MTAPIPTQLTELARQAPDAPAVTCRGRTVTRAELDAATNRLARAYAELGVGQDDYVTILVPNSIEWICSAIACWKLGAVPQPLSPAMPDEELTGILDLRERALLVGRPDPRGRTPHVDADFIPDPTLADTPLPEATSPAWKAMASGGSTGRPKLIESGGDSRVSPLLGFPLGMEDNEVQLISVPMSHNTGFTVAVAGLLLGHHLVVMPRFDPHEFPRLITEHRVSFLATVPTIMQRLLPVYRADPDAYDLSSIRRFWHLAAPCPPAVKEAWIDLVGPEAVWELYGGTELQALTFISGDQWLTHRGSVGVVVAGEMKVFDDDGNECPPGQVGEIYMRRAPDSPPTYRYIGATAKSRDGGWESIGDLGWFDEDGFLYLSDRRVDMFTVGGKNTYPAEVENALGEHPHVLSALVVGVPHDDLGQVPHALVQAAPGSGLDADAVIAHLRDRLEPHKVPRTVDFVDRPLRDEAGKARRSAVREQVIAARFG